MTDRERFLVMVICAVGLVALSFAGLQKVSGMFRHRKARIDALTTDIGKLKLKIRQGQQATSEMNEWEEQALSSDPEEAASRYKSWLTEWVHNHDVVDPEVKVEAARNNRDFYTVHPFTVSGRTDLRQLTTMMHKFYAARQLHRIRGLTVTPVGEKELDVYLSIDALALPAAVDREEIVIDEERLAALGSLEDFEGPIFKRNLFSPENNSPRLSLRSSYRIEQGKKFTLEAKADDKDDIDKLTYNADIEELSGARFRRGTLEWTPRELGEYSAVIEVEDDGIPTELDRKEIKFTVVEAREPPPPKPQIRFDFAEYTQFNAVIIKDDVPTAWLWVRPTDEMLKVQEGDSFEIGDMKGRMLEIGLAEAVFESDGRRFRMNLRQFVGKAEDIGEATAATSAEAPLADPAEADTVELLPPVEEAD